MLRELFYGACGLVLLLYVSDWTFRMFDDPREPPRVNPKVPVLSHVLGLFKSKQLYFSTLRSQSSADMFTVAIGSQKFYVLKSLRLLTAVQKASKHISFRPLIQGAAKTLGDASDKTLRLYGGQLVNDFADAHKTGLMPGPELDLQNQRMASCVIVKMDRLLEGKLAGQSFEMGWVAWVKNTIVQASAAGVWGEQHPYKDLAVCDAYWTWDSWVPLHAMGVDFTGKGYKARAVLFDAFRKYFKNGVPADASKVVQNRYTVLHTAGVSDEDHIKQEASFSIAVLPNTVNNMFWSSHDIFARPDLVKAIREELTTNAIAGSKEEGFTVDVAALKTTCPLILSSFQEMQRVRTNGAIFRQVINDIEIDNRYFLKKGNFVILPVEPFHVSTDSWGSSADTFDPYRFVDHKERHTAGSVKKTMLSWGSSPHLCPARQFASTEILLVLAMLIMRVDIEPAAGERWNTDTRHLTASLALPSKEFPIKITPRAEGLGQWRVEMGNSSKSKLNLASG